MNKKIKVTFYMKSGSVFSLKFDKFSIGKLSATKGERHMEYSGEEKAFTIDLDELECCIID